MNINLKKFLVLLILVPFSLGGINYCLQYVSRILSRIHTLLFPKIPASVGKGLLKECLWYIHIIVLVFLFPNSLLRCDAVQKQDLLGTGLVIYLYLVS